MASPFHSFETALHPRVTRSRLPPGYITPTTLRSHRADSNPCHLPRITVPLRSLLAPRQISPRHTHASSQTPPTPPHPAFLLSNPPVLLLSPLRVLFPRFASDVASSPLQGRDPCELTSHRGLCVSTVLHDAFAVLHGLSVQVLSMWVHHGLIWYRLWRITCSMICRVVREALLFALLLDSAPFPIAILLQPWGWHKYVHMSQGSATQAAGSLSGVATERYDVTTPKDSRLTPCLGLQLTR